VTATRALAAFAEEHREALRRAEREGTFPAEIYRAMGAQGWVGTITPKSDGGLGGGPAEYCFVQEQCARYGLVSPQISIQGERWLLEWGSEEQKGRYLRGMAEGSLIFCESISEPQAGSSFRDMKATARRDERGWVLDGHKIHVNLGADAQVTAFYGIAEEGLTSFLVDLDATGISIERTDPIGLRMLPTAEVRFDRVRVSDGELLGPPGRGLDTFFSVFNLSRLGNASELIGLARRALTLAIDYARRRKIGPNVVTDFQGIQWAYANCYAELYAAALARNRAAMAAAHADPNVGVLTSVAKKLSVDAAESVGREMFALIGGHGLYHSEEFSSILNDIKVLRVAGGSLEVLRNYIAKVLLRSDDYLGLR
jgi:alkylation response protein AidB-like acyl-CoA dehydrogenase